MKILALIPARGGSKRLPGKNIKSLGGVPLIGWTIRTARASDCFSDVLVSTDDPAIAEVARQQGASVPWLRPAALATDTAASVDVVLHALDAWEAFHGVADAVMLLQPTSPFRSVESIRRAVSLFEDAGGAHPVVSVCPASSHPAWCFRLTSQGLDPFLGWGQVNASRSQDLEPAWMLNGAIYMITPARLKVDRTFIAADTQALVMEDAAESIDVDTAEDFARCEASLPSDQGMGHER